METKCRSENIWKIHCNMLYRDHSAMNMDGSANANSQAVSNARVDRFEKLFSMLSSWVLPSRPHSNRKHCTGWCNAHSSWRMDTLVTAPRPQVIRVIIRGTFSAFPRRLRVSELWHGNIFRFFLHNSKSFIKYSPRITRLWQAHIELRCITWHRPTTHNGISIQRFNGC